MTTDEIQMQIDWLKSWAADRKCYVEEKGEVGFGRPCVGIIHGTAYVDLGPPEAIEIPRQNTIYFPAVVEGAHAPAGVNAYHKHDCLAVLARPIPDYDGYDYDAALVELFTWVQQIDKAGLVITTTQRKVSDSLELALYGPTVTYLEKP